MENAKRTQRIALTSDEKKLMTKEIIGFFETERGEELGLIAAEEVLDFFTHTLGEVIYRKGVADAKKLVKEKMEDVDVELELLSTNN